MRELIAWVCLIGFVLPVYAGKAVILTFARSVWLAFAVFGGVLATWLLLCWVFWSSWGGPDVSPAHNYVGMPVALLTVPTLSFLYDLATRKGEGYQISSRRTVFELVVLVPVWFCCWIYIEFDRLQWIWI